MGSDITTKPVATLAGTLSANGSVTLTRNGRAIRQLGVGLYRFSITDDDPHATFTIEANGGYPIVLARLGFTGLHSTTVTLTAGPWRYYSSPNQAHEILVTD